MTSISDTFDQLCALAALSYDETGDTRFESRLLDILNLVKSYPQARDLFVEKFKIMLSSRVTPLEVVEFCMRELQWEEVKCFALALYQPSINPRSQALAGLISAYEEVWPDEDLYRYYSNRSL
ncbi:hypothetical protein GWQ44_10780 [Pseudomonas sp. 3MA1]|uniref:hypothetical protein n=1 Tax=Pseudomonas sp. 3MA1 TaxID=2699196 RepID=UPI0023DE0124|nr:hypothetical protein [Pseudomonas sp. 3MA1]MDF2396022.1 hypothetical protein [Pseudomonas sp. 3MA1]